MSTAPVDAGCIPPRPIPPSDPSKSHDSNGKTVCYLCRRKPAVRLPIAGRFGSIVVFCSMQCAAISGVDSVLDSEIVLCTMCESWTDKNGVCPVCDIVYGLPEESPEGFMFEVHGRSEGGAL